MCGICGQFNFSGRPVDRETLQAMTDSLRHRGPDSEGLVLRGPAGLGHRRLSILDLSEAGNQPMASRCGSLWIVFNGEIYNFAELKRDLEQQGEIFISNSDTEVLLRLYQKWGPACLEKLQGMFAFAVWDDSAKSLFLARDRIGIKPLYYYLDGRRIVFASEIKSILQCPQVRREVNPAGLLHYFTFGHSVAPDTIYSGIRKLLPGHYLVCDRHRARVVKYWDIREAPARVSTQADATEHVQQLLQAAVRSHMVSDVPVGAFLSGGIDSSAVVAFMSCVSTRPVKTFAMGFDVGGYFNELDDARAVAHHFGTEHHETVVTQMDVEALLHRLVYHYDEPFADAANLPTLMLSEFARQHVKVVLSGEGGDEVFGGYRRYCAHLASCYFPPLPAPCHSALQSLLPQTPRFRRWRKAAETVAIHNEAARYAAWLTMFTEDMRAELLKSAVADGTFDSLAAYRGYYNHFPKWGAVNRCLYTDVKGWLPDTYLEKIDKAAMAVGLEGRVPFLDHRLMEYVFRLPGRWKINGWRTKILLGKSLAGILPRRTLRKPKHGFAVPVDQWFRGRLKNFCADVLLQGGPSRSPYLDHASVEKIFRHHVCGERDFGIQLWALLNFELWHRRFMTPGVAPTPRNLSIELQSPVIQAAH